MNCEANLIAVVVMLSLFACVASADPGETSFESANPR